MQPLFSYKYILSLGWSNKCVFHGRNLLIFIIAKKNNASHKVISISEFDDKSKPLRYILTYFINQCQ